MFRAFWRVFYCGTKIKPSETFTNSRAGHQLTADFCIGSMHNFQALLNPLIYEIIYEKAKNFERKS